jgi:hypothetical protein
VHRMQLARRELRKYESAAPSADPLTSADIGVSR